MKIISIDPSIDPDQIKFCGLSLDQLEALARERGVLDRREGNTLYLKENIWLGDCGGKPAIEIF